MTYTPTLDLTLLGIGGAFDADRNIPNTGALLELSLDPERPPTRILIDCGHTCGRQLHALGLSYKDIDTVLLTHAHGDHMDGLEVAGYKSKFLFQKFIKLISPQPVLDAAWASLHPKMGRLQTDSETSFEAQLSSYFQPFPASPSTPITFADGHLEATFLPVRHVHGMPAFCILISAPHLGKQGPHIHWSGDTIFTPEHTLLQDLQPQRGDLLFHDCIFFPYYPATVHTHFEHLITLPETTRQRTVLVHHGRTETNEDLASMTLGQPLQKFRIF